MKKEDLTALGLTDEQAEKVMNVNSEQLKEFVPYARFKELIDDKNELKKQVSERDKQLESLKNSTGDMESLKATIAQLQADNKAAAENYQAELDRIKLDSAVNTALLSANTINPKAVRALLDMDRIKMDGETLLGINEQIESLKKAEDSKMLFKAEVKAGFSGVKPGEGNTGSSQGEQPKTLANAIMAKLTGNNE